MIFRFSLSRPLWISALLLLVLASCSSRKLALPPEHNKKSAKALLEKYEEQTGLELSLKKDFMLYYAIDGWMGVPYRYGGTTKRGVDCSGFSKAVYQQAFGIQLPHASAEQYKTVKRVRRMRRLKQGELVFFSFEDGKKVSHVGIYLGNFKFAHASTSRGVIISDLKEKYYKKGFVCGGRIKH